MYSLISGPPVIAIDADSCIEDVIENAYQASEMKGVYLREVPPFEEEFTYGAPLTPERKTRLVTK